MRQIHGHDAAFPYEEKNGDGSHYWCTPGMTLRDYFAAKAITAILRGNYFGELEKEVGYGEIAADAAEAAYEVADAMLAARKGGV